MTTDQADMAASITMADKEQVLERNAAFCMAPWMHLHVLAEGQVTPCCESREMLGNINRQSFQEIWNGAPMRTVRAQMLRGERLSGCQKCFDKEDSGVQSLRERFNSHREHLFECVVGSGPDGQALNAKPVYWDIRFSNICNFRCRSCWHGSSSRWFSDGVALGITAGDKAIIHGVEDAGALFEQLDSFLPHLEEVYFAGGEPLIMDEHYRLLDLLIERGCCNVALSYNTNLSVTGYKGLDVLERWNKFPKIKVEVSIDAAGARGELMRKEQNWQETIDNIRRVRSVCPHIDLRTETTVSIFNVLHLPVLFRELIALDFVAVGSMSTHLLQDPPFYSIRALPPAWKAKVRKAFAKFDQWFEERLDKEPDGGEVLERHRRRIAEIVSYMDSEDWSHLLPRLRQTTARLDSLRSEAAGEIFPELAPLLAEPWDWRGFGRARWQALWGGASRPAQ
jgi:radical SAM protein with 4Fe4S-binding SPASM domain